jgi:hypothetical protein
VRKLKYLFAKWRVLERFNHVMFFSLVGVTLLFISYLSLFDRYFLVKAYTIQFTPESYLSTRDTKELIDTVKDDKLLWVIPSNQLWFLNSQNLSFIAKRSNPEIQSLEVQKRVWPNTAEIAISTEPILLTLGINSNEYWRISKSGEVVTQDEVGMRSNLVVVDKPVIFNKSSTTLKDISFTHNAQQYNRFWYVRWLWDVLKQYNIMVVKTAFPSLFDTDVIVTTDTGTQLKFSSEQIAKDIQEQKIKSFFVEPNNSKAYIERQYTHIDFRVPKKIFLCQKGSECEKL